MTAKKTPKAPQDRKPKAAKITRPEDTKGFELLHPIDEVPVWDQAPLLSLVAQLTDAGDDKGEVEMSNADAILLTGQIASAMRPFAVDEKQFIKFATGRTALQDIMNLALA